MFLRVCFRSIVSVWSCICVRVRLVCYVGAWVCISRLNGGVSNVMCVYISGVKSMKMSSLPPIAPPATLDIGESIADVPLASEVSEVVSPDDVGSGVGDSPEKASAPEPLRF